MKTTVALADWDANIKRTASRIADSRFDAVVLCVEERHVIYRAENVIEAVDLLKSYGLEVLLDPWGIEGFSGESTSHPMAFYNWLKLARVTNADGILLDEPTPNKAIDFEDILAAHHYYAQDKRLHLAIQPQFLTPEYHDAVDEVSISGYFLGDDMTRATPASVTEQIHDWYDNLKDCIDSAWVQTWGIPEGKEWVPALAIETWASLDVPVNVWAWDALRTVSSKRSDDPALVWDNTLAAIDKFT